LLWSGKLLMLIVGNHWIELPKIYHKRGRIIYNVAPLYYIWFVGVPYFIFLMVFNF
jgi:hypothetical protein